MAVVKINALDVVPGQGPELERRFAERAGEIETMPGFLGFELLRPVEGETRYFVCTRWESDEAFQAWVNSEEFKRGHAKSAREGSGAVAHGSALLSFEVALEATPRAAS